jgi:hypothetical protein
MRLCSASRDLLAVCADSLSEPLARVADALRLAAARCRAVNAAVADVAAMDRAIWEGSALVPVLPPGDLSPETVVIGGHECRLEWLAGTLSGTWMVTAPGLMLTCHGYPRQDAIARMAQAIAETATQTPSAAPPPTDPPPSP